MRRQIVWSSRAAKDLGAGERDVARRIVAAAEKLAEGEGDVRRLKDVDPPTYRLRVGDWRLLFRYERGTITILRVLPRDKACR
jgi:mRNA-degrading endonuclease RelE of RelBE toxin-antitoxin system